MRTGLAREKGFTLIELLIVVAIIGLLSAIAIPQFSRYRDRGYASSVRSDVKLAYQVVLVWFNDNQTGSVCPSVVGTSGPSLNLSSDYPGAAVSEGVTISVNGGTADAFEVIGTHAELRAGNKYQVRGDGVITDNLF